MLDDAGIELHTIVGNHDMHYKNTNHPNAITELLDKYDHGHVYDSPKSVVFDDVSIDLIPWMCDDNAGEILVLIYTSSAEYCIGHW